MMWLDSSDKILLNFLVILLQVVHAVSVCETYKVSGTQFQKEAEGNYEFFAECFDRPSYKRTTVDSLGRTNYLFYYGAHDGHDAWMVGPQYCHNHQPLLRVSDSAEEPSLVRYTWEERYYDTSDYFSNHWIDVSCDDTLPLGAVVGITVGVTGVVLILVCTVSLYIYTYRKRKQNARNNHHPQSLQSEAYPTSVFDEHYYASTIMPGSSYGVTLPPYSPEDPCYHNQVLPQDNLQRQVPVISNPARDGSLYEETSEFSQRPETGQGNIYDEHTDMCCESNNTNNNGLKSQSGEHYIEHSPPSYDDVLDQKRIEEEITCRHSISDGAQNGFISGVYNNLYYI